MGWFCLWMNDRVHFTGERMREGINYPKEAYGVEFDVRKSSARKHLSCRVMQPLASLSLTHPRIRDFAYSGKEVRSSGAI